MSDRLHLPPDRDHLRLLSTAGSTNDEARDWAQAGAPDGACVVADAQTAGRGRRGRSWHSPPGCNLYLSMVVRADPQALSLAPLLGALASREALERTLAGADRVVIKWPNDILVNGRKLAGVLAELHAGLPLDPHRRPEPFAVVGIGVNVNAGPAELPERTRWPAGSLSELRGRRIDRSGLLADLIASLDRNRSVLRECPDRLVSEVRAHCATLGRRVRVSLANEAIFEGLAKDLAPDGALVVQTSDGCLHQVLAGDVDLLDG